MQTLKTIDEFKKYVSDRSEVNIKCRKNRMFRKAIESLKHEGIIYIPIGNHVYKRIELCTKQEQDTYIRSQVSALKTQYFNLMRVKHYISDELMKDLHDGGLETSDTQ